MVKGYDELHPFVPASAGMSGCGDSFTCAIYGNERTWQFLHTPHQ
jgi:hypothetical protein